MGIEPKTGCGARRSTVSQVVRHGEHSEVAHAQLLANGAMHHSGHGIEVLAMLGGSSVALSPRCNAATEEGGGGDDDGGDGDSRSGRGRRAAPPQEDVQAELVAHVASHVAAQISFKLLAEVNPAGGAHADGEPSKPKTKPSMSALNSAAVREHASSPEYVVPREELLVSKKARPVVHSAGTKTVPGKMLARAFGASTHFCP